MPHLSCAQHFLCRQSLLEFSHAGRSTVTSVHWLLLGFWDNACNPRFITCDDPVHHGTAEKMSMLTPCILLYFLVSVTLALLPGTQFSEQQVLCENFKQHGAGNITNLLDRIHCLKCFSHNVSGLESTPVFRWGFVVRMTVFIYFLFFIVNVPWLGFEPANSFVRQFFGLVVRKANH